MTQTRRRNREKTSALNLSSPPESPEHEGEKLITVKNGIKEELTIARIPHPIKPPRQDLCQSQAANAAQRGRAVCQGQGSTRAGGGDGISRAPGSAPASENEPRSPSHHRSLCWSHLFCFLGHFGFSEAASWVFPAVEQRWELSLTHPAHSGFPLCTQGSADSRALLLQLHPGRFKNGDLFPLPWNRFCSFLLHCHKILYI